MIIYQRIIKPLYTVFYSAPDYEKYIVANSSSCGILLLADHIAPYLSYKADAYNCICTSEVPVLNFRYSDPRNNISDVTGRQCK